ncbi:hypothetical protein [Microscilla marina]|uniref:Uncharacterized protein n=1 Tax=Microscilla marina ATCC 23134 TaxID=313606 RepID=A1ZPL1_MICM2|nr:hypothetical protein [Microscilla marina]EAY27750.1 hypothetical protein M23134_03819 [Microscilla marina ATCC 23134]
MIGIDIGRVIISGDTDVPDQFFSPDYLKVPQITGAFEAIKQIVMSYKAENVHLISKCGQVTQVRTLQWLQHYGFFQDTGFTQSNIWFCEERHQKHALALQNNIRVFIDDRYSVLKHLTSLDRLYLFQPSAPERAAFEAETQKDKFVIVNGWNEVLDSILSL